MVEKLGCSICCFFFSLSGVVFCMMVGLLLENQPQYIKGIETDGVDDAKTAVFESAYIYLGIMALCALVWTWETRKKMVECKAAKPSEFPDERTALLSSHR